MTLDVTLVADPLLDDYGPGRPTLLLGRYLVRHARVTIVAPFISSTMESRITGYGLRSINLGFRPMARTSSAAFFEAWLKEALFKSNDKSWNWNQGKDGFTINLSDTVAAPADVWYIQGLPVGDTVAALTENLPPPLQAGALLGTPILRHLDIRLITALAQLSRFHVSSSAACGEAHRRWGVRVDRVIHPPVDTSVFRPTVTNPAEDYCLTYLGKETDYAPLLSIADEGVRVLAFGSKYRRSPGRLRTHPRIRILREVSDSELAGLYSNAKFTVFPFSTEAFGYIPVESMACGTPVITYGREGPSETVIDGKTGWLRGDRQELVRQALRIWRAGPIPKEMREACRGRGLAFSDEDIGRQWLGLIKNGAEGPS